METTMRIVPMPRIYIGDSSTTLTIVLVIGAIVGVLWVLASARHARDRRIRREALSRGHDAGALQQDHAMHTSAAPAAPAALGAEVGSAPAAPSRATAPPVPPRPPLPPTPVRPTIAARPPEPSTDLDETRVSSPLEAARWTAVLADGRTIALSSPTYIGRSPSASTEHPGATLVPLDDRAKSMSKTHARIVPSPEGIEVTDLHSTNGTTLALADGTRVALTPGEPRLVTSSAVVSFGDQQVVLRGRPS